MSSSAAALVILISAPLFVHLSIKLLTPPESANDTREEVSFLHDCSLLFVLVKVSFALPGILSSSRHFKRCSRCVGVKGCLPSFGK